MTSSAWITAVSLSAGLAKGSAASEHLINRGAGAFSRRQFCMKMSSIENADDGRTTPKKTLDLQLHTRRKSPADFLASLSDACKRLGVDAFDVYGDFESDATNSYLRKFESEVAHHFGKEDGVFCLSGGMAQSIVLAINARKHKKSVEGDNSKRIEAFACHPTSHLLLHENNHFHELLGMEAAVLNHCSKESVHFNPDDLKDNGCYGMDTMRLSHLQDLLATFDGESPTPLAPAVTFPHNDVPINCIHISTLIIELPHREIGGKLTPWDEVEEMARICTERGINFHCDGARIFEASDGYEHNSVKQTAQPFDSVYISFCKGLANGIGGAMLLGDAEFCKEARVWLRRFGGNLYSVLPYAVASWDGFRRNCVNDYLDSSDGYDNQKHSAHSSVFKHRQKKLARVLEMLNADQRISSIVSFDPVAPETNMVHGYLRVSYKKCMKALDDVEQNTGIRVLSRVRRRETSNDELGEQGSEHDRFGCRFEWTMGETNSLIDDKHFVSGWKAFAKVLMES